MNFTSLRLFFTDWTNLQLFSLDSETKQLTERKCEKAGIEPGFELEVTVVVCKSSAMLLDHTGICDQNKFTHIAL